MGRPNYYILLDLKIDPPEEDPGKIEEAIKKKQALWSKVRNHPTKGIQAKQYIGMIPDIRNVMADKKLREKEALEAREIRFKKQKEKFAEIDGHLEIFLSKGDITEEEVSLLASRHSVNPKLIQKRVDQKAGFAKIDRIVEDYLSQGKLKEKDISRAAKKIGIEEKTVRERIKVLKERNLSEIDIYFNSRIGKGYVAEREIESLSRLYQLDKADVHRRVKLPIKKEGKKKEAVLKPLDKTIEKLINDNLRIVGKSSLYEFLRMPFNASLEELQKKAKEKESEIRKITQKDAATTASAALAGHCIAIFKAEETRIAYDESRIRFELPKLNANIEIAGLTGTVYPEYIDHLVRIAVKFGMEPEEASRHIKKYITEKKWNLKTDEKEKRKVKLIVVAAAGVAAFLIVVVFAWNFLQANKVKKEYRKVTALVQNQTNPEIKERALREFVAKYGNTDYAKDARNLIRQIEKEKVEQDYRETMEKYNTAISSRNYSQAYTAVAGYLNKHPGSRYTGEVQNKVEELRSILEEQDYRVVKSASDKSYDSRIDLYQRFLRKYPNGKYFDQVQQLIEKTFAEYVASMKSKLDRYEKNRQWQKAIDLTRQFVEKYPNSPHVVEVKGLLAKYQRQVENVSDFTAMKRKAESMGEDYLGAKQIFLDYMNANPEAPSAMKQMLSEEIERYDRLNRERIEEEKRWEDLVAYGNNRDISIHKRVQKFDRYVRSNPPAKYRPEAERMLELLRVEQEEVDAQRKMQQEKKKWKEVLAYATNSNNSLTGRIARVRGFLNDSPNGTYSRNANVILKKLLKEKAAQDSRLQAEQATRNRIQSEANSIKSRLGQSGGRFTVNGNNTVVDRKTGLMWTLVDSEAVLGQCIDYNSAVDYVNSLNMGGYRDWRLPTANELMTLYKTRPFFPSTDLRWYWSSEVILHGWNKKVQVVNSKSETSWKKQYAEMKQCGSVMAVRQ